MPRSRFVWSLYALMLIEGVLFTILAPLLPSLKAELDLSTSQSGILAAGYVAGAVIGGVPAGLTSARLGVKTCAVTGMALLAGGTLAFGICQTFVALLVAQLIAGVGCAGIWIGAVPWLLDVSPPGERGAVMGTALGIGALGEILGPVVGAVAANVGRTATFTCIAGLAVLCCCAVARVAGPPEGVGSLGVRAAAASRPVRMALYLMCMPTVVWGALVVLGSLELARLGAGPTAIAATFGIAAAIGVVQAPLVGSWSDRRGRLLPIRLGLLMCIPALVALSWAQNRLVVGLLMIFVLVAIRFTIGPTVVLLADACRDAGSGDVLALALWLPAAAAGIAVGSAAGGALAQAAGSSWTYNALAACVLVALLSLWKQTDAVAADEPVSRPAPSSYL